VTNSLADAAEVTWLFHLLIIFRCTHVSRSRAGVQMSRTLSHCDGC
jgi:hypothetical protein